MDVAVPILGSIPCDKAAYHKGLKSVEQKLEVLDAHLRSRTFLVSTDQNLAADAIRTSCAKLRASIVVATDGTNRDSVSV